MSATAARPRAAGGPGAAAVGRETEKGKRTRGGPTKHERCSMDADSHEPNSEIIKLVRAGLRRLTSEGATYPSVSAELGFRAAFTFFTCDGYPDVVRLCMGGIPQSPPTGARLSGGGCPGGGRCKRPPLGWSGPAVPKAGAQQPPIGCPDARPRARPQPVNRSGC